MSFLADLEQKYIDALDRIKALEAEVAILRTAAEELVKTGDVPAAFRLTKKEVDFLQALMGRASATKEQLLALVYADRWGMDDEPEIKIVDVFICKLRKKLKPFGVTIETLWGRGYALPVQSKETIRAMVSSATDAELRRAGRGSSQRA
jgi:two-component system, cell cycle response regulator CtrA